MRLSKIFPVSLYNIKDPLFELFLLVISSTLPPFFPSLFPFDCCFLSHSSSFGPTVFASLSPVTLASRFTAPNFHFSLVIFFSTSSFFFLPVLWSCNWTLCSFSFILLIILRPFFFLLPFFTFDLVLFTLVSSFGRPTVTTLCSYHPYHMLRTVAIAKLYMPTP